VNPKPPTYPARPLNGGSLDVARPKRGEWCAEPKLNGWRTLIHRQSGAMFNRKLEPLSIAGEFELALDSLRIGLPWAEWVDCEALERRHGIGKGTLIVLDFVSAVPYTDRRQALAEALPVLPLYQWPDEDQLWTVHSSQDIQAVWEGARKTNDEILAGAQFYEGIVCKRAASPYPVQLVSATRESPHWIKHRWKV
jgi:ATP-dependent DNA ligase